MNRAAWMPWSALRPSQLYVSAEKLAAVQRDFDPARMAPLPVRRFGDAVALTDGHTRAVAAHLAGRGEIPAYWDEDEWPDWEAYEVCLQWCREEGVLTVGDLAGRIVSAEEYERLWLARCRAMHEELRVQRLGAKEEVR